MTKLFLCLHVVAAILVVGPIAVAGSMFPRLSTDPSAPTLHRICRVYGVLGAVVPVLGLVVAVRLGVLTTMWVAVSLVLTAAAFAVLWLVILPRQRAALTGADDSSVLAASTGVFNMLWVGVTILMIVRPGSTTGA